MIRLVRVAVRHWRIVAVAIGVVLLLTHPAAADATLVTVAGVLFLAAMWAVAAYTIRKHPKEDEGDIE